MKHYLIDSENVGDFWIPLLDLPADMAKLIVFYTKNSPHMSYDSLIKLKESDRTVTFIKCYEGTNALDFQLCTELGFLIAGNPGDEFIIVTNDTGYDAAVKYWRRKEYSVKRIAGKDSRTGSRKRGTPVRADVTAEVSAILHKLVRMPDADPPGAGAQVGEDERAEISAETDANTETVQNSGFENEEEIRDEFDHEDEELSEEDTSEDDDSLDEDYEDTDPEEFFDEYSEEETDEDPDYEPDEDQPEEPDEDQPEETEEDAEEEHAEEETPDDLYEETVEVPEDEVSEDFEEISSGINSDGAPELSDEDPGKDTSNASDTGSDEDSEVTDRAESEGGSDREPVSVMQTDEEENGAEEVGFAESAADSEASASGTEAEEPSEKDDEAASAERDAFIPDPEEITAIVNCIGMDNLAELHNQLIQFYGDNGKDLYLSLKSGALTIEKKDWDREEKFLYYCALIFRHSDEPAEALTEENIREFASFILGAENKRKNLNSLRYALLKHYGKEKGRRYYFMLKPYVKALNQM